jgi:hypothetical protein
MTAMTEEQLAIHRLIDTRGRGFVLAIFKGVATEDDLAQVLAGHSVDEAVMKRIQSVLRERLTND